MPIKRKLLRACHVPYMKKVLRKAIMKKSLNIVMYKIRQIRTLNLVNNRRISTVNYVKREETVF